KGTTVTCSGTARRGPMAPVRPIVHCYDAPTRPTSRGGRPVSDQKTILDQMRNAQILDTYIHPDDLTWAPFPGAPGIDLKVFRVSSESGAWTVLFRCATGSGFP